MTLSKKSRVIVKENQVSCELEEERVILNLDDNVYYGLNEVGSAVWDLIQQPTYVSEICDAIAQQFEVKSGDCEKDVLVMLGQLEEASLLQVLSSSNEPKEV